MLCALISLGPPSRLVMMRNKSPPIRTMLRIINFYKTRDIFALRNFRKELFLSPENFLSFLTFSSKETFIKGRERPVMFDITWRMKGVWGSKKGQENFGLYSNQKVLRAFWWGDDWELKMDDVSLYQRVTVDENCGKLKLKPEPVS